MITPNTIRHIINRLLYISSLVIKRRDVTILYPRPAVKPIFPKKTRGFLSVDTYRCNLCGKCRNICPSQAIGIDEQNISIKLDYLKCMYCCYCVISCPRKALSFSTEFEGATKNKDVFEHSFNIININETISGGKAK